jgi:Short C-terminal domain
MSVAGLPGLTPEVERTKPANGTIIGVAAILFGATLAAVGFHHVVATGTCSSSGYIGDRGPVPFCPRGSDLFVLYMIAGVFVVPWGASLSGAGVLSRESVAVLFLAFGLGGLSDATGPWAHAGHKGFFLVFGGVFFVLGLLGLASAWGGTRSRPGSDPTGLSGSGLGGASVSATASVSGPFRPTSAADAAGAAVDEVARLAALRDKGVLTEDEFQAAKRRALGEH